MRDFGIPEIPVSRIGRRRLVSTGFCALSPEASETSKLKPSHACHVRAERAEVPKPCCLDPHATEL